MLLAAKALHLIAMVTWFAGLFYMFRLFVYHTENKDNSAVTDVLKVMERKLFRYITTPGMLATLVGGITMLVMNPGYLKQPWIHMKLTLVALLVLYHFYVGKVQARFENDDVYLSSKQCRWLNEVPTPILILVIVLAVFRPSFA